MKKLKKLKIRLDKFFLKVYMEKRVNKVVGGSELHTDLKHFLFDSVVVNIENEVDKNLYATHYYERIKKIKN